MEVLLQPAYAYPLAGAIAGLLAGLLGVGGGLLIVPALVLLFSRMAFSADSIMQLAVGTSLATIVLTSLSSLYAHHRHGAVRWRVVGAMSPGIIAGALGGAWLAHVTSSDVLRMLFGAFEVLVALYLAFGARPAAHRSLPGSPALLLAGMPIGGLSSLLGIGGGTLTVPYLLWHNLDIRAAVGTSAACGLPIALAGGAAFALAGAGTPGLPGASTGYIYWPAAVGIAVASTLCAPFGARLAHAVPRLLLQRIFAVFLALVGLKLFTG